jgi:hypothetical protein
LNERSRLRTRRTFQQTFLASAGTLTDASNLIITGVPGYGIWSRVVQDTLIRSR